MDAKGARDLARLLEERHGAVPPVVSRKKVAADTAAPIFHWFGVEPPASQTADSSEPDDRR
jgi:hypothetical protein